MALFDGNLWCERVIADSDSTPVRPEEFLHFVELDEFTQDWVDLGLDIEKDMWALAAMIMHQPNSAPVIAGTGGLRKLRFTPPGWSSGKSGALRVCYAYYPQHWLVLLVMAYAKGEQDTLTPREKRGIKSYLEQIGRYLDSRP